MARHVKILVLALFCGGVSGANAIACVAGDTQFKEGPTGSAILVEDGDTVVLSDGQKVRLIGLRAPKHSIGRENKNSQPLGEEAKAFLSDLVLGKSVALRFGGTQKDRYGRLLAHLFIDAEQAADGKNGIWVQEKIITHGMARVYSLADNTSCLDDLLVLERRARENRLGVWAEDFYHIHEGDNVTALQKRAGNFNLVEGLVLNADLVRSRIYLNFGSYWKEDFTIIIDKKAQKLFDKTGIDPLRLEGANIRVRGWIDIKDGPRIEVTHPEQIEILAIK